MHSFAQSLLTWKKENNPLVYQNEQHPEVEINSSAYIKLDRLLMNGCMWSCMAGHLWVYSVFVDWRLSSWVVHNDFMLNLTLGMWKWFSFNFGISVADYDYHTQPGDCVVHALHMWKRNEGTFMILTQLPVLHPFIHQFFLIRDWVMIAGQVAPQKNWLNHMEPCSPVPATRRMWYRWRLDTRKMQDK